MEFDFNMLESKFVFEMIYRKGIDEESRVLCWNNSELNRVLFLELMHLDIDAELKKFKDEVESLDKEIFYDLIAEVSFEYHRCLRLMSVDFIRNGEANYDDFTYLKVIKRNII